MRRDVGFCAHDIALHGERILEPVPSPTTTRLDFNPFENLSSERAKREWARCCGLIKSAADAAAGESLASIEDSISAGRCFFWAGPDCAAITRFEEFPNGARELVLIYVGGDLEQAMRDGLPALEHYARLAGCTGITVLAGENETLNDLKALGFRATLISMTRPITREVN